jgi:hypothetical protein
MTLDQELAAACAIIRIGLDRVRDAATRAEEVAPHIKALRALHDHRNTEQGVLAGIADVLGTIAVSLGDVDDDRIEGVVELLDEAQAYVQDSTGEHIDRALEALAALKSEEER